MPRALVTGGAGFIGSHITDALLEAGCDVVVIDNLSTGREENLAIAKAKYRSKLELVIADIGSKETEKVFADFRPESVFHLAAQMNVRHSVDNPVFDAEVNVVGTVNLLQAAAKSGTRGFIFSSTGGAIYGEQEEFPASENHRTQGESPYGISKRSAELYLDYYSRKSGLNCAALRYGNVYGPRQNSKGEAGVIAIFCENAIAGKTLTVNGDGLQTRDYVFVGDVVRANMLVRGMQERALSETGAYSIFNVGTGVEKTVLDIISALRIVHQDAQQKSPGTQPLTDIMVEHGPALQGEQRRSVIESRKLREALSWNVQVGFEDGIAKTYQSFLKSNSGHSCCCCC